MSDCPKNQGCRISFDEKQSLFQLDFASGRESRSELAPSWQREVVRHGRSLTETGEGRESPGNGQPRAAQETVDKESHEFGS